MPDETKSQELVAEARRAREARQFALSIQLLQDALAAGGPADNVYFQMGNTYADASCWDDAAQAYQLALEANPKHHKAMHNLGVARRRQGRFSESVRYLKAATKLQAGAPVDAAELSAQSRQARLVRLISLVAALLLASWLIARTR